MNHNKAFTIVEVLITFSILSLMLSLVFTSVRRSKSNYDHKLFLEKIKKTFLHLHNKSIETHTASRIIFDFQFFLVKTEVFLQKKWIPYSKNIKMPSNLRIDEEKMEDNREIYRLFIDKDGVSNELLLYLKNKRRFFVMTISTEKGLICEE